MEEKDCVGSAFGQLSATRLTVLGSRTPAEAKLGRSDGVRFLALNSLAKPLRSTKRPGSMSAAAVPRLRQMWLELNRKRTGTDH